MIVLIPKGCESDLEVKFKTSLTKRVSQDRTCHRKSFLLH